jgi:3',5'-cyclic AMP phosphodiesterase CpdA
VEDLHRFAPDVLIATGDLTQRARRKQFDEASRFLRSVPGARVVVPGNHDIAPAFHPVKRLFNPFQRYRQFVFPALDATYVDENLIVLGVNTAAPFRWKEGVISTAQLDWLERTAASFPSHFKVLASHHPLVQPVSSTLRGGHAVRGSRAISSLLERARIDLVLSGHLHETRSGPPDVSLTKTHDTLIVQASTATSTRLRGHANAYNQLFIEDDTIELRIRVWTGKEFETDRVALYERSSAVPCGISGGDPHRDDEILL